MSNLGSNEFNVKEAIERAINMLKEGNDILHDVEEITKMRKYYYLGYDPTPTKVEVRV